MKTFQRFTLLLAASGLIACAGDPTFQSEIPTPEPEPKNPHAITVHQALDDLQSVLDVIDAPAEGETATRSRAVRRVKSVETVTPAAILPQTRAAEATDVEELFHIVNFEDEAGYAILGADDRLESIYAITDEGSLTVEELQRAANATPEEIDEDPTLMPLNGVAQSAASTMGGLVGDIGAWGPGGTTIPTNPPLPPAPTIIRTEHGLDSVWYLRPLSTLKLHQGHPCNYFCTKDGARCKAGCAPVAAAQLLMYNYKKYGSVVSSVNGHTIDWEKIERVIENPGQYIQRDDIELYDPSPEAEEVARLIRELGALMKTDYGVNESSTNFFRIQGVLEDLGYSGVHDWAYQKTKVYQMLQERIRPTIVGGKNEITDARHCFIIDGLFRRDYTETIYYSNGNSYKTTVDSDELIHCNFGYEGLCNGFYYYGAFDLREGPELSSDATELDEDEKEKDPTKSYDMTKIITYTHCP